MKKQMGWCILSVGTVFVSAILGCQIRVAEYGPGPGALVDGLPAEVVSARLPEESVVRLASEHEAVTIHVGAPLDVLPAGALDTRAIALAIETCEGATRACVSVEAAELEVTELADGDRRIDYRATRVGTDGARTAITGSFVIVLGDDAAAPISPRGI